MAVAIYRDILADKNNVPSGGENQNTGSKTQASARGSYRNILEDDNSYRRQRSASTNFVSKFFSDANQFFGSAEQDLSDKNLFNAAEFFEERKKQAGLLKNMAATVSKYLDENMDSYPQESYDSIMEYLSTFDTNIDDVLAQYQPILDSKAGMRAYEDELLAAMERNAQLKGNQQTALFAFDPSQPTDFFDKMQQYTDDQSYRSVTDNWTDEERFTLGLLQKEDPAKAAEYAVQVNNYYNAMVTEPERQKIREQALDKLWRNTGKALLASTFSAQDQFMDRMAEYVARGQTTEKDHLSIWDYAQETTGAISQGLNENAIGSDKYNEISGIMQKGLQNSTDPFYQKNNAMQTANEAFAGRGFGDLYNLGYSIAQNTLSRHTYGAIPGVGQAATLANYFASAATSGIDDARRMGATGDQAVASGVAKGTWEVATEIFGLDNLYKMGPAITWGDLFKQVGTQGAFEAFGEGANAALGYMSDKYILGDLSEYEQTVQRYIQQGETEETARRKAFWDAAKNVGFEALSGAVSGWVSGGVETAYKTGVANQYYRNVNPQDLIDIGLTAEQGSNAYKLAEQMQNQIAEGQEPSGNQKRILGQNIELQKLAAAKVAAESAAEEQPAAQEPGTKKPAEKPAVSKDGRSIQISTENPIDINDFAEIKNGKATIQLKDGGTVEYSDVSFATEADANQYYAVSTLPGIETESANDLLHTIQEAGAGQDDQGIIAVREAYRLGYAGAQASELARSDASVLPADLQQKVFEIGQSQRRADAMAKPTVRVAATKPTEGYKKVVIEGKISKPNKKTQKKWDREIALMDYIADNFSGNAVHVYESYKGRDGKYYYRDSNGKVNRAPNGMYANGEIWVDLRSGDNQEGLVLNTFAHEMYHHIERFDKAKAQELAEFVVKELGMESVDKAVEAQIQKARKAGLSEEYFMNVKGMTAEQARNEVYMRAMSDFVADSLETMFTRGDPAKAIADLKKENRTLFDQIKAFIDKWVSKLKDFYKDKTVSEEGAVVAQLKNFEQLQKLFMEGVQSAGENYRAAVDSLTPGEAGEVFNEDGDPVAMSTEDGSVMLSVRTYEEEGRKAFRDYLQKCVSSKRLTETQMQEMIDGIEEVYQICKEFKDKYAPFSAWSDAEVIRDTRGRPVFSVVTPNGDYKMNLDFSLVCKKRRTLDAVFNEMSRRGIIDDFELGQKSVVKINEIIRNYGLETACALCFVDAKRFRQASMADSFTRLYNELVESLVPEDQKGSIDHFNFSGYETIKKVDGGIDTWDNSRLDFSHLDDVMKRYGKGTVEHKAARYIKNNPKGRKLLLRGDFMSSQGFDAVKTQNRDILKLYNSKKGTGGPKAAFGDVQYLNEIIKKSRTWTPSKAYEVGGVRIQSFSDYVPRMVFDYVQMIYDLAATKLPAHAYTKESLFVKQFGLTGVKINMSLIPAIAEGGIAPGLDANGNYVWAGESFNYDTAVEIQNAEGYTENCGTICVGVSKQHIEKLLRDPNIRMVIPYHKSGLNPIVAHMNKIAEFTDYTNDQRTKGKDGKAISTEFNFNEAVKRTGDPKAAADEYLKWCMANGYTAKFAEFAAEENYYKLLEDFTLYDKDGNYVPQREVRAVFPSEGSAFGTMKDLIESGLEEDAVVEGKRDSNLSAIVDEIQRTLPKTEAEIGEEQVAQANRDLEADAKFSTRDSNGNQLTKKQQNFFKDTKVRNADGDLLVMYHGTKSEFTVFDSDRLNDGLGFFFTDDKWEAYDYGTPLKCYLNIKNPFNMHEGTELDSFLGNAPKYINGNLNRKAIVKGLIEAGYDGIYAYNKGINWYIAFKPEQIKRTDNRNPTKKSDIRYSLRNEKPATDRDILMNLDANAQKVSVKGHLQRYQDRVSQLFDLEARRELVNAQIKELSSDPKKNRKELAQLRSEARNLSTQIKGLNEKLMFTERSDMMRSLVAKKRLNDQRIVNSYKEEQKDLIRSMKEEHRVIRKELTGTDGVMFVMEDTFLKLAKDYEAKKIDMKTMEKEFMRITKEYDEQKREYDNLMWEYQNSGWKVQKLEAKLERQKEAAKTRVNKVMYAKIQRKVDELNRLLLHGSKHRNIPEYLQPVVAQILDAINMETKDAIQRANTFDTTIERYNKRIAAATDPLTKEALIEQKKRYMSKGDQFVNKMAELKEAYQRIQDDRIPGLEIDEGLAGHLQTLFVEIGNTPLREMTRKQLNAVNDVLNITKKTIVEANKLHQEGQRKGVEETSKNAMREIRTVGGGAKKTIEIAEAVKKFGWDNLKPVYVFEAIGSKVLTGLFNNLRKGEDTLARDLQEGRTFFQNQWQKHKGENWDKDKKWAFTSTSGKRFELDLMQIMSLYALSKRDQARDHLRVGGFSFDSQYKVKDEVKIGPIKFKADVKTTDASAYNLSDETLGEIIGKLTAEQRAFVDEMQAYLSDTMAAKGNEISMKKYGIRLFKEKNYFPLRVSDQFMAKVREQQTGDRKLKNSGFTKETTPNAKNPVVLSSFLEVWAEHVDEMSLYHSFVLPLDDMSRVLNYHEAFVEENAASSVVEAIRTAYGEGATKYIDQLIRDINGGARADGMASTINKMMSKARKAQTMASLSVAIQQPSSILRACAEIDGKYFLGRRVTEKMQDTTWEEIKEYAPIAIIKEKGGFDTNVGKSTVEYLTDTANYDGFGEKFKALFTDSKFRDDALGRLPALMDELSWGVIWNAVKREQADKHPNMDVKSDAFMKLVADRFTDVIVKTQVYDSVFSRSGMMRSKDSGVKMVTAFMAEPTTTANMLAAAIFKAKRGEISKADAAKTVGAIVASLAANAALVSLVYAMRDDDEDKRYDEKWIENFYSNFFESLNPIGYIPILRDIQSMAKGFDVERADMALFGDLMNAIQGLSDEKRTAWEKTEAVIGSVGNLFGVPLKNIIRDGKGFYKTLTIWLDEESKDPRTKTGRYMARRGLDLSNGEELLLAIQRGDMEHIQRVAGRYENQQKAESALQSAIRAKYLDGDLTAEEAEELLTTNFDREDENEVYWILDSWDYAKENKTSEGYAKYGKFLDGVEDGEFQDEMERLMEHGAEASDISSSITRKYRKQYLEDETAREDIRNKLRPVFEATGMYDDEIDEKFNDWDFEAEYGMTYSAFKDEYKAGNVTEAEMRDAMDFYGLLNYEIAEAIRSLNEDIAFEKKYGMSLSEMEDAYDHGDVAQNQMKNALVFTGMTQNEAKNWIKQRNISNQMGINYAEQDDAYKHGDISRQTLYNSMIQNGATKQEADEAIIGYDWLKKHVKKYPELTISDAKKFTIRISDKQTEYTLTDYGVSIDSYIEYTKRRAECTGVDADGDGQIDNGTLRDEIFQMIDSLPISSEAKDGLAQIGYSIKSIKKNAPWH